MGNNTCVENIADSSVLPFLLSVLHTLPKGHALAIEILENLLPRLEQLEVWSAENLSSEIREFCDAGELKLGKVAQPIRCAVTGTPSAPGVFEVMELFGKEETLARIADQAKSTTSEQA